MNALVTKWIPTTNLLHLRRLGKLLEEGGELVDVAARCIIQGIDEIDPASGRFNRNRLEDEIADVKAQCDCTIETFALDVDRIEQRVIAKKQRMAEWEALCAQPDDVPSMDELVEAACRRKFKNWDDPGAFDAFARHIRRAEVRAALELLAPVEP